jgi:hypothetical protein
MEFKPKKIIAKSGRQEVLVAFNLPDLTTLPNALSQHRSSPYPLDPPAQVAHRIQINGTGRPMIPRSISQL